MPISQVMGNALIKDSLLMWAPHTVLLSQNQETVQETLPKLQLLCPLIGLTDANKNIRLINKNMSKGEGRIKRLIISESASSLSILKK